MDKEKDTAVPEVVSAEESKTPEKKSLKSRLSRYIGIAAIVLVGVVIFLWLLLDWSVAATIRNVAPVLTGTPVELQSVRIGILRGRVELVGFKVGNPEGFARPYAFELDKFVCQVDLLSALSSKVIVDEVSIHGMLADYEVGLDGSNLGIIQKNVESFIGKADAASAKDADSTDDSGESGEKPAKKVVIRKLDVDGVSLAVGVVRIPLPPISLNDLGDGKSMGEVVNEFYAALMKSVAAALSSQAVQGVTGAAKGLGNAAGDAAKGLGNAAKDLGDAVTNIFKKK